MSVSFSFINTTLLCFFVCLNCLMTSVDAQSGQFVRFPCFQCQLLNLHAFCSGCFIQQRGLPALVINSKSFNEAQLLVSDQSSDEDEDICTVFLNPNDVLVKSDRFFQFKTLFPLSVLLITNVLVAMSHRQRYSDCL